MSLPRHPSPMHTALNASSIKATPRLRNPSPAEQTSLLAQREKAHIAAIAIVDDAQIGEIVPERAAGERYQDRLVQQQREQDRNSEGAGKNVPPHRDPQQYRAENDDHGNDAIDHHPPKAARETRVPRGGHRGTHTISTP